MKMNTKLAWTSSYINCRGEVAPFYENCYLFNIKVISEFCDEIYYPIWSPSEQRAINSVSQKYEIDVKNITVVEE